MRLLAPAFDGVLLIARGEYDFNANQFGGLDLTAFYRLGRYLGVSLNYAAPQMGWSKGSLQAQLSVDLAPMRIAVTSGYQAGSETVTTSSYAEGGMLLSEAGVQAYSDITVGESAVIVIAFHDLNQNGVRDAGEPSLEIPRTTLCIGATELYSSTGVFRSVPATGSVLLKWTVGGTATSVYSPAKCVLGCTQLLAVSILFRFPSLKGWMLPEYVW